MLAPTTPRPRASARPVGERFLAWLYTGPLGHLYGAVADISVLWVLWILSLARARLRRARAELPASRRNSG